MTTEELGFGDIRTDHTGYTKLIDFYDRCCKFRHQEIMIDFSKLTWVDANMSAFIMATLKKLENERYLKFFVDGQLIKTKFNILIRNGLIGGLQFSPSIKQSAIKLTGFQKDQDEAFLNYIEKELLSYPNLILSSEDKYRLIDAFCELFTNVQKHARTDEPLFACGQYYPLYRRLSFTLVDLGIGYLPPIQEFTGGRINTSADAILWALKGNTTKQGVPGGLGLTEIQKFCNNNGAKFVIMTGDAFWTNYNLFPVSIKPFCGTTVNIIFDCRKK